MGLKNNFQDDIKIKVRSTGRLLSAKINIKDNKAGVEILDEETGISPGQACVFYSKDKIGDKVLGGGWINSTVNQKYIHIIHSNISRTYKVIAFFL